MMNRLSFSQILEFALPLASSLSRFGPKIILLQFFIVPTSLSRLEEIESKLALNWKHGYYVSLVPLRWWSNLRFQRVLFGQASSQSSHVSRWARTDVLNRVREKCYSLVRWRNSHKSQFLLNMAQNITSDDKTSHTKFWAGSDLLSGTQRLFQGEKREWWYPTVRCSKHWKVRLNLVPTTLDNDISECINAILDFLIVNDFV